MSTSTDVATSIVSVLTVGVGGMVGWTKRSISNILKQAEAVREQATTDLNILKSDLEDVKTTLATIASNTSQSVVQPVKKAPARRAVAKKAATK